MKFVGTECPGGPVHADQGAQFTLGVMYQYGWGVPRDYVKANMWYFLAAASGFAPADKVRNENEKQMTLWQINEAKRLSSEWKPSGP
jgi:TPR repeat protein